jgi:hypothetical protein
LTKRERRALDRSRREADARKAPEEKTISTEYLRRQIEAERQARVTVKAGGITPVMPSVQVDSPEGRIAWKAWKAREARLKTAVVTRAKAKQASDGRSDREIWYQHYKSWGIRGSK